MIIQQRLQTNTVVSSPINAISHSAVLHKLGLMLPLWLKKKIFKYKPDIAEDIENEVYNITSLERLQYILTSPNFRMEDDFLKEKSLSHLLKMAAEKGELTWLNFIVNTHELSRHVSQVHLDEAFFWGCMHENLTSVKHLLASDDISRHADINSGDGEAIVVAVLSGSVEIIKLLLTDPIILNYQPNHANLYVNPNFCILEYPFLNSRFDVLQYLIEEYKMEMTPAIEKFAQENNEFNIFLQKVRLNEKLHDEMPHNGQRRKTKI